MLLQHNFKLRSIFYYSMNLSDLKVGERGLVMKVNVPPDLRERLRSLGVGAGRTVRVLRYSLFKSSIMIETTESIIGLRREIAKKTEVKLIGGTGNFVGRKSEHR